MDGDSFGSLYKSNKDHLCLQKEIWICKVNRRLMIHWTSKKTSICRSQIIADRNLRIEQLRCLLSWSSRMVRVGRPSLDLFENGRFGSLVIVFILDYLCLSQCINVFCAKVFIKRSSKRKGKSFFSLCTIVRMQRMFWYFIGPLARKRAMKYES